MNFAQKVTETFYQSWEKFKDLLNACPHHGYENWRIISFFYEGLQPKMRQFVETMCNGEFFNKEPEEAFEYFDYLSENAQSRDVSDAYHRNEPLKITGGGKYNLREVDDLHARVSMLTKKLETIDRNKVSEAQVIQRVSEKCNICEDIGHPTNDCPTIPAFKEVLLDQSEAVNMISKPFAGASGSTQYPTAAPYGQRRNLEETVHQMAANLQQFMQGQATINNQTSQAINEIRGSLTRLTTTFHTQEKGKFLTQSQPNPQGQIHQVSKVEETSNTKPVKDVTTLRSGKILVNPTPDSATIGKDSTPKHVETEVNNFQTLAPFPTRLTPVHKDKYYAEIFEVFKQVRINIPLLDAIQQIPTYAKFLKDLCNVKRKLNVKKKAFLTKQVSAIIQSNTPPKYKDPGSPTIACMIGNSKIGHALLDLRSSVNLLPYCVYEKLGLGELKSTSITLQLVLDLEGNLDSNDTSNDTSSVSYVGAQTEMQWKLKDEQLPPVTATIKPSEEQIPALDLNPLPTELKYAFLGPNSTLPIVISSCLTNRQEEELLQIYLEEESKPSREMQEGLILQ
ncbi:uncharacterized protein LOC122298901 [Carya illinoinensis]|uniref:uncharacterized protein LOC122298901 n=1 Tax=Carya illinoinensis TaxID=32201 RepID=UPI001C72361E|nr:uncharacterized protein LOC122298901 [Carya illinoinensis]